MNLANILTRKSPMKRAFVTLESGMDDVLTEEFMLPEEPGDAAGEIGEAAAPGQDAATDRERLPRAGGAETAEEAARALDEPAGDRLTNHAQGRLSAVAAFDEGRSLMQRELEAIGSALARIVSTHHMGRDFIDDSYAEVRRSNDLEIMAAGLSAENGKLTDRLDKLEKLRSRYDQLIDVLKRREAKLVAEAETMREALTAAKLEAVEARNAAAHAEFVQGELQTSLAAKSSEAERFMRDNELLREKNLTLTLDLDKALQRQAETRRKYEDLTTLHASEMAKIAKLASKLGTEEKEAARLQKLVDSLEQKLVEANETISHLNGEMHEHEALYQRETHALKSEVQTLASRLQAGATDQNAAAAEMQNLHSRISELESEKAYTERKLADQSAEMEADRARQASQHAQQVRELRTKIDELTQSVSTLRHQSKSANGTASPSVTYAPPARTKSRHRHKVA